MAKNIMQTRPRVSVGTIGHIDHGKTTLTSAILRVQSMKELAEYKPYEKIARGGIVRDKSKTVTVISAHVEYQTETRGYAHIDCPGHADYIKNMITGAAQMDGAILLVSGPDGPMHQTREHVLLARQIGVENVVVFVNKCDLIQDPEILDLVEMEVRELLDRHGYDGDNVTFVFGSAKLAHDNPEDPQARACIEELLGALDRAIPDPVRLVDQPFLMPIENIFGIEGRGTVVTGKIEAGSVRTGDHAEIIGLTESVRPTVVKQVETFGRVLDIAEAGENVGCLLRGVGRDEIARGQVLAAPGSVESHASFEADVYVLNVDEGGRKTPFIDGYSPQFYFRTANVTGVTSIGGDVDVALPGDAVNLSVQLGQPIAVSTGDRFAIREGGRSVGSGVVTRVGS